MQQLRVSYLAKDKEQLVERSQIFSSVQDAIDHIKEIRARKDIVGSPLFETVGLERNDS